MLALLGFKCDRCHFTTTKKSSILNHYRRKLLCTASFSDASYEELLAQLAEATTGICACTICHREFKSPQYLALHEKQTHQNEAIQRTMAEQAQRIQQLEENQLMAAASSSTVTATFNNFITININNFGSEDRSYVDDNILRQCLEDSMRICKLVDHIYFNPAHPENHTMKLKSEKKSRALIRVNDNWVEVDMNTNIDTMIHRENTTLCKFFYEHIWSDPTVNIDKKAWTQSKLVKINDKDHLYFEQRRFIQARLKAFV